MIQSVREKVLLALRCVSDVIERTYGHNEACRRDDSDPVYSGADIVEMLCEIEEEVAEALMLVEAEGEDSDVEER